MAVRPTVQRASATGDRAYFRFRELIGYAYISPWIVGFAVFVAFPLLMSLYLSFTQYNIITQPRFIGLENYRVALFEDELFWAAVWRTAYYALLAGTLGVVGSLLAAVLLNQSLKGTVFFRTFFYLPSLTPIVASALLWVWIFQPEIGVLNYLLSLIGIEGPRWLQSTTWAIPSLVIIALWGGIGGSRMIIFLAGLQGVPQELYDAAAIDGASSWQRFWHVTLPMISPSSSSTSVIVVIGPLPGLLDRLHRDRRRAGLRDLLLRLPPLQERLQVPEHGLRLGAGLDLLRDRAGLHLPPVPGLAALGLLQRGGKDDGSK